MGCMMRRESKDSPIGTGISLIPCNSLTVFNIGSGAASRAYTVFR